MFSLFYPFFFDCHKKLMERDELRRVKYWLNQSA